MQEDSSNMWNDNKFNSIYCALETNSAKLGKAHLETPMKLLDSDQSELICMQW